MSDLVQAPSFRLAHLSDLHFSNLCWNPMQFTSKRWIGNANLLLRRMHEFRHDKVYQLAEYFKEIQVKYLVVSGDLSTTSQNCEFEQAVAFVKAVQAMDIEVITLPGNHDHYTKKDYKKHTFYNYFSSYFCQPDSSFAKYNLRDHKVSVKHLRLGYWLVTLDTALATPLLACHGHFSTLIESTLQEVLSLIPADDKVIMANHFPLFTCDSKNKHLQGDDRLRNLLHQFPSVKLYLHGHTHSAIWIIDETHTISVGAGGMTSLYGLKPDILTIGKAIAGGIPTGTFGMTTEVAAQIKEKTSREIIDTGGIGSTLAGNSLSLAAMRATLTKVLTPAAFEKMVALGTRWSDGVDAAIKEFDLPWYCSRLGARGEYLFQATAPKTGKEAADAGDFELEQYIHLRMLNDGFLITPFHNMALMSPETSEADVDAHSVAFRTMCAELVKG